MTGVVTDIGIELGKLLYWNRSVEDNKNGQVRANREKLMAHITILIMFLVGAIVGAISFREIGYRSVIPMSMMLMIIASVQIYKDMSVILRIGSSNS